MTSTFETSTQTTIQGDLHRRANPDHVPGDTFGTPPLDAGRKREHDSEDAKQPVQAVTLGINPMHAPYR